MTQERLDAPAAPVFRIKGGRISATTLELMHYDFNGFNEQLAQAVAGAPQLFEQMPIVLSLEKLPDDAFVDFIEICQICQFHGLRPVAIRGGAPALQSAAAVAGLASLPSRGSRPEPEAGPEAEPRPTKATATTVEPGAADPVTPLPANRVITAPVRSGQQIYARGGDLIVLAPVSAGAEILADGNIHVYGPLRGRALAGIQGDAGARIFCQSLEAELVSIAGQYRINEDLRGELWRKPVQVALAGEQLQVTPL